MIKYAIFMLVIVLAGIFLAPIIGRFGKWLKDYFSSLS